MDRGTGLGTPTWEEELRGERNERKDEGDE